MEVARQAAMDGRVADPSDDSEDERRQQETHPVGREDAKALPEVAPDVVALALPAMRNPLMPKKPYTAISA